MKNVIRFKLGPADLIQYVYSVALVANDIYVWKTLFFYHEASLWTCNSVNDYTKIPKALWIQIISTWDMCSYTLENNFTELKLGVEILDSKAQFKRRTSHMPNTMQMREIYCFHWVALDSAHVKFDLWTRPNVSTHKAYCLIEWATLMVSQVISALFSLITADDFEEVNAIYVCMQSSMKGCNIHRRNDLA